MEYGQAKSKIKSGDLIALSHKEWGSLYDLQVQAVRVFTESEYSHVAVAVVLEGIPFVLEAVEPKVRLMPIENILDNGFYWIPTNTPLSKEELEFGLSKVGKDQYSKLEAVEGNLGMLDIGGDSKWQCAELTITMRRLSGLDLGNHATPAAVVQKALELGMQLNYVEK